MLVNKYCTNIQFAADCGNAHKRTTTEHAFRELKMQTLKDLSEQFYLYAICEDCQRIEQLDLVALIEELGADFKVGELRSRLLCRSCRKRGQSIRIVYVGPPERRALFQYRR